MQQDMLETPLHLIPFPGADAKKNKNTGFEFGSGSTYTLHTKYRPTTSYTLAKIIIKQTTT
jgi:hypothetical protein